MHEDRYTDALTDAALDREIARALAVDPSPEFLARVRARVGSEPARAAWRLRVPWLFAAAGAIAAAIVMVIALSRPDQNTNREFQSWGPPSGGPATQASADRLLPREEPVADSSRAVAPRIAPPRAVKTADPSLRASPEVLVSASEAAALRRLLAGVREGRVDLSLLGEASPATTELQPPNEIAIPPITIDRLAPAAGEEGVRQ